MVVTDALVPNRHQGISNHPCWLPDHTLLPYNVPQSPSVIITLTKRGVSPSHVRMPSHAPMHSASWSLNHSLHVPNSKDESFIKCTRKIDQHPCVKIDQQLLCVLGGCSGLTSEVTTDRQEDCRLALSIPGGRFKNTFELLNLRALNYSPVNKIHIFQCMGKIFCVEFQRYPPIVIPHKISNPYIERYDFYTTLKF